MHAQVGEDAIVVGAAVTLTRLDGALEQLIAALPAHRTRAFVALREQLKYFAGVQIRNAAALGGNIVTGSPISDINPLLMACRATFTIVGQDLPERQASHYPIPLLLCASCPEPPLEVPL